MMRPRWQSAVEWTAAILMAVMWLVAGLYKLSDLTGFQVKAVQAQVPPWLSYPGAVSLGVLETFAGILLLAPAWRRWGAWLSGGLLVFFIGWVGYHYQTLTGEECSCFPWIERAVGPMFFVTDGAMVGLAALAGWWAAPSRAPRRAAVALVCVAALAGGALALDRSRAGGSLGPTFITAGDKQLPLHEGRVFLYFFNPLCMHCFEVAQSLSKLRWDATFVGLPTQEYELGDGFFQDTGIKSIQGAQLSPDAEKLKPSFPFQDVPYAVALEDGRVREKLVFFEEPRLGMTLRQIGFAQ
jgi:uncharacterized membrane protein YphA (DoxX/SURF4 family)